MSFGRDLYKTKLCSLYQRGNCPRQSCSFAHGEAELRRSSSSSFNGRRDFRGGDLRERLQRRHSPHSKRSSPGRDSRGRQDRRQSHSRSPLRGRASRSTSPPREKKRQRHDESIANLSDVSGEPREHATLNNGIADKNARSLSPDPLEMLEVELQDVDVEIESLNDRVADFQSIINDRTKDIDDLTAKNSDLDSKVQREHEEYKRCNSKLKKFLKLHLRFIRAQEEMKKSQARLQKLVEELPMCDSQRFPVVGEDSDINVVSDGAPIEGINQDSRVHDPHAILVAFKNGGDEDGFGNQKAALQSRSRPAKNIRVEAMVNGVIKEVAHASDFSTPLGKPNMAADKGKMLGALSDDALPRVRNWDTMSVLPSTGLAAHAEDDMLDNDDEKQPFPDSKRDVRTWSHTVQKSPGVVNSSHITPNDLPQVLGVPSTRYAQYEGDDEDVDVEETEDDMTSDGARTNVRLFPIS